jgi:hypothetical protein
MIILEPADVGMTKELSFAFCITKACSRTKFTGEISRNSKTIRTVSVAFSVCVSTLDRGEKIKKIEEGSIGFIDPKIMICCDYDLFHSAFQLRRPLAFDIRWYVATCEIRLA